MDLFTLILLALGLCFDSFAVSVSCGMNQSMRDRLRGVRFAFMLGFFQAVMPLLGWGVASEFSKTIEAYDHWIAFILLGYLGFRMIRGALSNNKDMHLCDHFNLRNGLIMGLATSIDALIAGVAMALLDLNFIDASPWCNMLFAAVIIGIVTVLASITGLFIGRRSRGKLGEKAELLGGIILILIGFKVLFEHFV